MIKEWATVVSWQNGIALVSCDVKASCSSCASRRLRQPRAEQAGPQTSHTIACPATAADGGQKVELGIAEGSLLGSAMLVYMSPLVGCSDGGAFPDAVWHRSCRIVRCNAGGVGGFWLRAVSRSLPHAKSGSRSFSALRCRQISFALKRSSDLPRSVITGHYLYPSQNRKCFFTLCLL
jgi:sigma-E factor negative regulatory protein RseC